MSKKLQITPQIADWISKSTDGSVDPNTVSVFECIATNSLPLTKRGTLFDKAIIPQATLQAMADAVNNGAFVPFHTLHKQGVELPVGRVFRGEVNVRADGIAELRALLYVVNTETDLISKIEGGAIDEVSVGLVTKHINCSVCGWDYKGEDATFAHIYSQTCENGHTLGENGTHTILNGLDTWLETSFVSLGAANNAKILSRAKSLMGDERYNKLAASGIAPEATTLFCSLTLTKEPKMDIKELVDSLTTIKAEKIGVEGELSTAKADVARLTGEVATLQGKVTELTAQANPELTEQLKTAQASLAEATGVIRAEADRLTVAAGMEKPAEAATIAELSSAIASAKSKLAAAIPAGGSAEGVGAASTDSVTLTAASKTASFKTR